VSERFNQKRRGTQWSKGKGHDTFCPVGPWLVTPDEVGDPQDLDMWLDVNGQRMQTGNTKTMIFNVARSSPISAAIHDAISGRSGDHRHAAGRGRGQEARRHLSEGGRRHEAGHRQAGRAAQSVVVAWVGDEVLG
jgi:2,4-diketo-3-deoxy-L-fuconate hydrolase